MSRPHKVMRQATFPSHGDVRTSRDVTWLPRAATFVAHKPTFLTRAEKTFFGIREKQVRSRTV